MGDYLLTCFFTTETKRGKLVSCSKEEREDMEAVAMEITGHKTRSMYRRYRMVDERDLREATEQIQAQLQEQPKTSVVVPIFITPTQAFNQWLNSENGHSLDTIQARREFQ